MLPARVAKHSLCITAGDETSAFFVPAERRSAAACPSIVGLTAGFSEHDPHRMMPHMCGLNEGPVLLAEATSTCRQVSIDATRCTSRKAASR